MVVKEEAAVGAGEGEGMEVEPEGGLCIGATCIDWIGELLVLIFPAFATCVTFTSSTGTAISPSPTCCACSGPLDAVNHFPGFKNDDDQLDAFLALQAARLRGGMAVRRRRRGLGLDMLRILLWDLGSYECFSLK